MKKRVFSNLLGLFVVSTFFTSCATIAGGSKYYAQVHVPEHHDARIEHNGIFKGTGTATIRAMRKEANNFSITVKKDGCETQTTTFTQRTFRGWAFAGTIVTWTGLTVNGAFLPIPFGAIVDGATGSWWKPNVREKGVSKVDYKNFVYNIDYTGCDTDIQSSNDVEPSKEIIKD
jgi:hypothetical protein